ncbi:3'-5' exonuclease [Burkholderia cenocepacia]|uniref:3'-5' exonuclease n=1 Tax=Burkholderia cenocepacia TaxID=95486 RepID=UPI000761442A|nr:3'-5' exonuclease [Burkholderia cenocepacia]KWU17768.1 hypothetical protein AS149_13695 [Burkholderia cenocepacia]
MNLKVRINNILDLATRLGRHISIFDLEGTGFRGPGFGITEVACFTVAPNADSGVLFGHLINPEELITPQAVKITGITQAMVADKELWSLRYAAAFKEMAENHWVGGFNCKSFDFHAVLDMNAKYGQPIEGFKYGFDVMTLHHNLCGNKKRSGTLLEIAALYDIKPQGDLHRANADTVLTVELFDALIETFGIEAVLARFLPKPQGAYDKLTAQAIAKYSKGKTLVSLPDLASAFAVDESKISYELGRAIDENLVDPRIFAAADVQDWLIEAFMNVDETLLAQGKLKPLYERLSEGKPESIPLDYVQLRIGLHLAELTWSTRKPL